MIEAYFLFLRFSPAGIILFLIRVNFIRSRLPIQKKKNKRKLSQLTDQIITYFFSEQSISKASSQEDRIEIIRFENRGSFAVVSIIKQASFRG